MFTSILHDYQLKKCSRHFLIELDMFIMSDIKDKECHLNKKVDSGISDMVSVISHIMNITITFEYSLNLDGCIAPCRRAWLATYPNLSPHEPQ